MKRAKLNSKRVLVSLVNENKELLFGAFDDSKGVTREAKSKAWQSIASKLGSMKINLISENTDWSYLRDGIWRNMKNMAKNEI